MASLEIQLRDLQPGRTPPAVARSTLVADLKACILEAATWCAAQLSTDGSDANLRPPELAPRPLQTNRWNAVDDVSLVRRDLVSRNSPGSEVLVGRFLVYFPDADLCDGAAEAESDGFFNVYNCPPFGTWVGYFEDGGEDPSYSSYLLTWVPQPLLGLADAGISVNPEECIRWLDRTQVRVRAVLRQLDLPGIEPPV